MTEQLLNLVWLATAMFAFVVVLPKVERRRRATFALAGALVLLFPIISISDDLSADAAAQEIVAVLLILSALVVLLGPALRLVTVSPACPVVAVLSSSDPRSPPPLRSDCQLA